MPKEFTIPPVSFPASSTTTPSPAMQPHPSATPSPQPHLHHRSTTTVPSAPFQPQRPSPLSFLSFDVSSSSAPSSSFPPTLHPSHQSHSSFLDEPPLLEELEINPSLIWHKTRSLLHPFRVDPTLHSEHPDLSGPFLYYISFCLFQLLAGKVQFGIILGWIAISSIFLYSILNFLAGRNGNLDLYRCVSVVGYCLMPIVMFSAASLFLPPFTGGGGSVFGFVVAALFVVWATRVCSRLLAEDALGAAEHRGLIAYPCFLIYTLFSMLVMF